MEIIIVIDGPISYDLLTVISSLNLPIPIRTLTLNFNHGLGPALAKGLKLCSYDYIYRFDTDDINCHHRLYYQYLFISNNPFVDVLGSYVFERLSSPISTTCLKTVSVSPSMIAFSFSFRNSMNHPSVLFKLISVTSVGSYQDCRFFEDYFLWLIMRDQGMKFANLPLPLVYTTRHSFADRRSGFSYMKAEAAFIFRYLRTSRSSLFTVLFLFIRLIIRSFPFQELINKSLPWRH